MFVQALVFVSASVALVAGSCCESALPQGVIVTQPTCSGPVAGNVVFTPSFCSPVASGAVFSSGPSFDSFVSSGLSSGCDSSSGFGSGVIAGNGPQVSPITMVQGAPITLPPVETPPVLLPSSQPIPPIRVLAERCICTKTIVKPEIVQRHVTAPKIHRYVNRTFTPVVENVAVSATPISQGPPCAASLIVASGSLPASSGVVSPVVSSGAVCAPAVASGFGCGFAPSVASVSCSKQCVC